MLLEVKIEHRLTEVEERSKSNTRRLDEVEKRQDNLEDLVSTVKVLADREERVETDVKEIKADVKTLADKPAKKWESLTEKVLSVVVGALIGFLLTQIGL